MDKKKMHQGMEFDLNIVNDKTKEGEMKEEAVGAFLCLTICYFLHFRAASTLERCGMPDESMP